LISTIIARIVTQLASLVKDLNQTNALIVKKIYYFTIKPALNNVLIILINNKNIVLIVINHAISVEALTPINVSDVNLIFYYTIPPAMKNKIVQKKHLIQLTPVKIAMNSVRIALDPGKINA
jgi:hypothetical protein